jgi:hypothetical protein
MSRRSALGMAALVVPLLLLGPLPARGEHDCEVPPEMMQVSVKLPHLAARLRAREPVGAYPYDGLWFDIGRPQDYEQAVDAWLAETNGDGAGPEVDAVAYAVQP